MLKLGSSLTISPSIMHFQILDTLILSEVIMKLHSFEVSIYTYIVCALECGGIEWISSSDYMMKSLILKKNSRPVI